MAKKASTGSEAAGSGATGGGPSDGSSASPAGPPRICFERILPAELDHGRTARQGLGEALAGGPLHLLDASAVGHAKRMAVTMSKRWPRGSTIMCRFLDGSAKMKKKVEAIAHQWEKHANIKFAFIASGTAQIRISFFADEGSWSAVGTDALVREYFPVHQPTMNYGWLRDDTNDGEYSRVVLHEFGHALGCLHEHQQPKFNRKWNRTAVLKYFSGPPNFWPVEEIESNVLAKYSPKGITATEFDPKSIMLYSFDAALFADNLGPTNENSALSPRDIELIKKLYPR